MLLLQVTNHYGGAFFIYFFLFFNFHFGCMHLRCLSDILLVDRLDIIDILVILIFLSKKMEDIFVALIN
jgi:hypothetical protein